MKLTLKEIIAGIVFIGTISGGWVTMKVRQDNLEQRFNRLEKSINEKLNGIEKRTDKIYEILISN